MEYDDSTCLNWKEILNPFLVEKNVMYNVVFRYVICQDITGGRRGRMAIEASGDQVCMSESM
jgi:hypothetical protein